MKESDKQYLEKLIGNMSNVHDLLYIRRLVDTQGKALNKGLASLFL